MIAPSYRGQVAVDPGNIQHPLQQGIPLGRKTAHIFLIRCVFRQQSVENLSMSIGLNLARYGMSRTRFVRAQSGEFVAFWDAIWSRRECLTENQYETRYRREQMPVKNDIS